MRFLKLLGLLGLVTLGVGCGLPSPYYLAPPVASTLASPGGGQPYFQFQSTSSNSEAEFRGFEVYYKLEADNTSAAFSADTNLGSTNNTYLDLQGANFFPLCSPTDNPPQVHLPPLIAIAPGDRGKVFTVSIFILNNASSTYSFTPALASLPSKPEVGRDVSLPPAVGTGPKSFLANGSVSYTNYAPTDQDFAQIAGSVVGGQIYVLLYALSYGLVDLSTPIYSSPVYLGYISMTIN